MSGQQANLNALERAKSRLRWLGRYWSLVRTRSRRSRTRRQLLADVVKEARQCDPGLRISPRTLQDWDRKFRTRGGPDGLLEQRRPPLRERMRQAAHRRRSAEAVRFFFQWFADPQACSLTKCHRLTVIESARRGWKWPKSAEATRTIVRRVLGRRRKPANVSRGAKEGANANTRKGSLHEETQR